MSSIPARFPIAAAVVLAAISAATPSLADPVPPETLQAALSTLESKASQRTGVEVACETGLDLCLNAYRTLLSMNWNGSRLRAPEMLVVSNGIQGTGSRAQLVSPLVTTAELATRFGAHPVTSEEGRPPGIDSFVDSSGRPREGVDAPEVCSGHEGFYNRLFAQDEFDVTVVRGYFDSADSPTQVEVDVYPDQDQRLFHDQVLDLVDNYGFTLESEGQLEARLSRPFYHGGRLKTARVRILRSTIYCPGEATAGTVHRGTTVCEEQLAVSRRNRQEFADALGRNEVVVYSGHSREGGGPDFGPNHLDAGKFPIRSGALDHVSIAGPRSVLYLNSCSSAEHFASAIEERRARLQAAHQSFAFVGNSDVEFWENNPRANNRLVIGLLEGECPEEIAAMIDASHTYQEHSHTVIRHL